MTRVPDIGCIAGGIIGISKAGETGRSFSFYVKLPGAKTPHQQIIVGIFRTWICQFKETRFSAPGKKSNYQGANDAKDGMVHTPEVNWNFNLFDRTFHSFLALQTGES